MAGFNSNYFNRNLLESMKDSLRSMMSENSKFQGTAMGTPNVGIGGPGDFSKVSDLQLQNRMRELKRHGLFGAKVKQSDEYLATEAEYKRRQEAKQPVAAEPPVPGLKGQASGADQRDIDAARTLPPSEPLKAPTTPPAALPKKASEFGSTIFGGPGRVVASTSTTRDGTPETTFGITPGETPRQREMASPELQSPINPKKDLSGIFDWSRGIFNTSATPTGKKLEPQDIRPAAKPEEQVPAPREASGAQIQAPAPGEIPQAVLDALRAPMGPKALRPK